MKVLIRLTKDAEAAALPILLRHWPGMVLPERTYLLAEDAIRALRRASVPFTEVGREAPVPPLDEVASEKV